VEIATFMKVDFFYDVVSPYSYLAFTILCRYEKAWGIDFILRPFFLGGVMKATGNSAPATLPARAPYLLKDLMRQSDFYDLPLQIPSSFPANTLLAMRFLTAVKREAPSELRELSRCLWQQHYGEGRDITTEADLRNALSHQKFDTKLIDALLSKCGDSEIKDALRLETEIAIEKGAFGAPTFFIQTADGEEMFFGSDRFHLVARLLGKSWDGPFPKAAPR
jgi:glutathione S-transferase kappa 1